MLIIILIFIEILILYLSISTTAPEQKNILTQPLEPVQKIVITNGENNIPISVLEIKAYDTEGKEIVGFPNISSVRFDDMKNFGPQYVVDGKIDLTSHSTTTKDIKNNWIVLNLSIPTILSQVKIYPEYGRNLRGCFLILLNDRQNIIKEIAITSLENPYIFKF